MLAFDLLRVALARAVNLRLQLPRVGAPMICIILCEPKRLQQPFQLQKHLILATPKDIGKDGPREVIDRVPKPPLLLLLADKRPHLIHLGFASTLDTHGDLVALPRAQPGRVHRLQNRFFLFELTEHGVWTNPEHPSRIANPAGVQAHVNDRSFHLGQIPSVAVVQKKTSCGTPDVLAQVALGSPGGFAAFNDLLAVTMRALDRDECHGPLLPDRGCQDQAQYEIYLRPSPRLEHYPKIDRTTRLEPGHILRCLPNLPRHS